MMTLHRHLGTATLEQRGATPISDDLLALVNQYAPAGEAMLTAEDVYVRSAMVCNDIVDHYSTRFTERALGQIVELLPGVNMMRNHNEYASSDLPVGRFIKAELVRDGGRTFVRAWFYYLKGDEFGDQMERYIRSGIWREVSISWWMKSFTCDVDGKPVGESSYYPGQELTDGRTVVGIMDDVVEVNEVSLVARGGQKETSIKGAKSGVEADDIRNLVAAARSRIEQPVSPLNRWWQRASRV